MCVYVCVSVMRLSVCERVSVLEEADDEKWR